VVVAAARWREVEVRLLQTTSRSREAANRIVRAAAGLALLVAVSPADAGVLRGRLLLGGRPAPAVTASALPYETALAEARREARRLAPPAPLATATSLADGSFALSVPGGAAGQTLYTVRLDGPVSAATRLAGVWDAAESADLGEVDLAPGATLAGRVVDAAGTSVAGAEVVATAQLGRGADGALEAAPVRTTTAADGSFRLVGVSAVGNALRVDGAGAMPAELRGVRPGALRAPVVLGAGVAVSGRVRRPDGTTPAAGALVRLTGAVTTRWVEAGADGSFTIPGAPPGPATVEADAGEAGYLERPGVLAPLPAGKSLDLVLRPPSALAGRTVDATSTRPVARVRITLHGTGREQVARSGPDGSYAFPGLPPGSWQVRADEPRYVAWVRAGVPVRSGETRTLEIPLVLGATLSGRVVDEASRPVAAAVGSLAPSGPVSPQRLLRRLRATEPPAFKTRPDGSFVATRLSPGEGQILTVSHPDFERATLGGLSLAAGAVKTGVTVVLRQGAVVAGVVKDGQGLPIAGAKAELRASFPFAGGRGARGPIRALATPSGGSGGDRRSAASGKDGAFAIRGVAPGEYVLTVTAAGYASERVDPVKVPAAGPAARVEVTLAPGAAISGRVAFRSGLGAEGFRVFVGTPGRPRFAPPPPDDPATGSDGAFTLDGLKPGESYDLQVVGPNGPGEGKHDVVAPASDVQIVVTGSGRITGATVDATSGNPITDFQVAWAADRGGGRPGMLMMLGGRGGGQPVEVQSDDGSFALENVPAGTWSVVVSVRGYQPAHTGGVVVEEGATRAGVVVRAARGTVLKGYVVDAQTAAAIANAAVSVSSAGSPAGRGPTPAEPGTGAVTTDADGYFELDGVAPGKQTVQVSQSDYSDAVQTVDVADDGATVTIHMSSGGALGGMVASDTGQPVPGASVALSPGSGAGIGFGAGGQGGFGGPGSGAQESVSDASGRFRFDHLAAGRYTLTASLGSRTASPVEVVLQPGQAQEGAVLRLETGVTVAGTVTGLPPAMVAGTTVGASGADAYAQTTRADADGHFELDNVPLGVVNLHGTTVSASGSTRNASVQVTATGDQPVVTVELAFPQGFALSGQVSQAGQPVAGPTVIANLLGAGRQASATSDDAGAYRLEGLQEGTYTVVAVAPSAGGVASRRLTVTLSDDQSLDIAFPSARIGGVVVDSESKTPLANATVSLAAQGAGVPPGPGQRPVVTDSNGQFSFAGLDEGAYTLSTSRPDYQLDQRDVTAGDDGAEALVVPLRRGAGLALRVLDGLTGMPLRAVAVRILDGSGDSLAGPEPIALDGDGQGEITSLPPGVYTIVVAAAGYAPARLDGVNVPSAPLTVAVSPGGAVVIQAGPKTMAAGNVVATMTGATGQPATLSLLNLQGRVAVAEPTVQLRNVPPGAYVLALPAGASSPAFAVSEGGTTTVQLP
jgi:large repetitive protein